MAAEEELTSEQLRRLYEQALEDDPRATKLLIERCKRTATLENFTVLSMGSYVRNTIADRATANEYLRFRLVRESELYAAALLGTNPSRAEIMLAEQVSLDWMSLRMAQIELELSKESSFEHAYYRQSRVESAHRRLMASMRTLAQIRKLQTPNLLQVNIADQQVNVAPAP